MKIQPNTTYVASYFAPHGHYSVNGPSLASAVDNAPLHAARRGKWRLHLRRDGHQFPTETYKSSNYWVDVLFSPELARPCRRPDRRRRDGRVRLGHGQLDRAERRQPADQLRGHPVHRRRPRRRAKTITGTPPGDLDDGQRPDPGHSYTFTVKALERGRHRPGVLALRTRSTPAGAVAPGRPDRRDRLGAATPARWSAGAEPTDDGGSAITGYKVTPYLGTGSAGRDQRRRQQRPRRRSAR